MKNKKYISIIIVVIITIGLSVNFIVQNFDKFKTILQGVNDDKEECEYTLNVNDYIDLKEDKDEKDNKNQKDTTEKVSENDDSNINKDFLNKKYTIGDVYVLEGDVDKTKLEYTFLDYYFSEKLPKDIPIDFWNEQNKDNKTDYFDNASYFTIYLTITNPNDYKVEYLVNSMGLYFQLNEEKLGAKEENVEYFPNNNVSGASSYCHYIFKPHETLKTRITYSYNLKWITENYKNKVLNTFFMVDNGNQVDFTEKTRLFPLDITKTKEIN